MTIVWDSSAQKRRRMNCDPNSKTTNCILFKIKFHTADGKIRATGYGFQGYPELRNIDIKRSVKAYLRDEEGLVGQQLENETAKEAEE